MHKKQPEHQQNSSIKNRPLQFIEIEKNQTEQSKQISNQTQKGQFESLTQIKTQIQQNKQLETKNQTSLDKIQIQSPFRKLEISTQHKQFKISPISPNKIQQKKEQIPQKLNKEALKKAKSIEQFGMKSTIKSNQKITKSNKPFYQETYYITGIKQNYLLLLSDRNQVLQFPISMFTEHGASNLQRNQDQSDYNDNCDKFHLIKDIKIGQAIKIKLQFDFFRQQKDEKLFNSLQTKIKEQYCDKEDTSIEIKSPQKSFKKINPKFS